MARTIVNPIENSALISSTMRSEMQLLENEIAHTTSGHDHDGVDSKKIPAINSTHFASTAILESYITDANVLARIAGNETISGAWSFSAGLTNLKIITSLVDTNGAELIDIGSTPSAVNQVKISNAITGTGPIIASAGETNVDLFIRPKGSGDVRLGNANLQFPNSDGSAGYALKTDGSGALGWDILNPMTTAEDIIVGGASGAKTRLGKGSNSDVLTITAGSVVWGTVSVSRVKFGGDGSDGALSIDENTTTIDASNALVVVKNYTSISITNTAKLTISNPHANGTMLVLKCTGAVVMTSSSPSVDMDGMGASAGTNGSFILDSDSHFGTAGNGGGGAGGVILSTPVGFYTKTANTLSKKAIFIGCGSGGGNGGQGNGGGAGGGGGAGSYSSAGGAGGNNNVNGDAAAGNSAGGGGGGGNPSGAAGTPGTGGRGGGALLVECAGDLNFTGSVSTVGNGGGAGTLLSGGAGGGAGGMVAILYQTATDATGTMNTAGGAGGGGPATSGGAGGGSDNVLVTQNTDIS